MARPRKRDRGGAVGGRLALAAPSEWPLIAHLRRLSDVSNRREADLQVSAVGHCSWGQPVIRVSPGPLVARNRLVSFSKKALISSRNRPEAFPILLEQMALSEKGDEGAEMPARAKLKNRCAT